MTTTTENDWMARCGVKIMMIISWTGQCQDSAEWENINVTLFSCGLTVDDPVWRRAEVEQIQWYCWLFIPDSLLQALIDLLNGCHVTIWKKERKKDGDKSAISEGEIYYQHRFLIISHMTTSPLILLVLWFSGGTLWWWLSYYKGNMRDYDSVHFTRLFLETGAYYYVLLRKSNCPNCMKLLPLMRWGVDSEHNGTTDLLRALHTWHRDCNSSDSV